MDMMMALRAHTRGGPEQLVYEQAPVPVPQPGEALVAVHAAAITFAELASSPTSPAWWTGAGSAPWSARCSRWAKAAARPRAGASPGRRARPC